MPIIIINVYKIYRFSPQHENYIPDLKIEKVLPGFYVPRSKKKAHLENSHNFRQTKYRQQVKTFRLKYIFLAGKIIRTARSVVMKLSDRYPFEGKWK
jgi:hypothetical protein